MFGTMHKIICGSIVGRSNNMNETLSVGAQAPDFELPATGGTRVRLSEVLREGPALLLFYPLDWSPVCTREMCGMRDGFKEFQNVGIKVFGISVDSIFSHEAFAEKHAIPFPLLSDFNREVCTKYGVVHEEVLGLRGIAKRAVFIIGQDGRIRYRWVSEDPGVMPDIEEIKKQVRELSQ